VKWLTRGGLLAALLVGGAVTWGLGWRGLLLLLAFFISGSLLTRAAGGGGGQRTWRQVLANGGVAGLAALGGAGAWEVAAASLAAATADTWATEIGSFSPWPPRFLTTWARVPAGTSGGITALGTLGGVAGAVGMAGLAMLLHPQGGGGGDAPRSAALIAGAGFAGMLVDSLLGATLQGGFECSSCAARTERGDTICHGPVVLIKGRRWLDNDGVNLAATLSGAAVALAVRLLA
jgi:uncharacterized protein (TIGR00297 family)